MSYKSPEELQNSAAKIWAEIKDKELSNKERMAIPVQEMPSQDPHKRRYNMDEVALGYSEDQARVEASRCLNCKNKPCVKGCPVSIDIPGFITPIVQGDYKKSMDVLNQSTLLPAICGRVCPQESQCQEFCTVGKGLKSIEKAVSIGRLERFIADWARENNYGTALEVAPSSGKRVAVIGSGPASLSCAADVRRAGHEVVIFEAFHKPGGVMVYGIPEFRLPKAIVQKEIDRLKAIGVEIRTSFLIGRTRKLTDLLDEDGFDAAFIGTGAGLPRFMGIPGENLVGVFSANEYLTRSNLMKAYDKEQADTPIYPAQKVAVLGGGNVAMDAARTALRLGASEVYLLYRRSRQEMPARWEEIAHAEEEGVQFRFLTTPKQILADDKGRVRAIENFKCELGEPDASGRRRPQIIEGSEEEMPLDAVIVAIGNTSNPLIKQTTPGLQTNRWGNIETEEGGKTNLNNIYAGGDIVLGAATVILAMGEGRKAAEAINQSLSK